MVNTIKKNCLNKSQIEFLENFKREHVSFGLKNLYKNYGWREEWTVKVGSYYYQIVKFEDRKRLGLRN